MHKAEASIPAILTLVCAGCLSAQHSGGQTIVATGKPQEYAAATNNADTASGSGSSTAGGTVLAVDSASDPSGNPAVPDNPTSRDGRGTPDLTSPHRPAAWVCIDGQEGIFIERNGVPQIQWTMRRPVGRSPTFRVEAYKPLLGVPKDFHAVIITHHAIGDEKVAYTITSKPGSFEVGKEYSLLNPGENFTLRDALGQAEIEQLPLLPLGSFGIVASVRNSATDQAGLAVTYFDVVDTSPTEKPAEDGSGDGTAAPGSTQDSSESDEASESEAAPDADPVTDPEREPGADPQ